jgi:hypothetical protein
MSSNALAKDNGTFIEDIVKSLISGAQYAYNGLVDFNKDGTLIEVKSCQYQTISHDRKKNYRIGRFTFSKIQHETLIETDGEYILIVHQEKKPVLFSRTKASALNLPNFSGKSNQVTVPWNVAFMGVIVHARAK